MGVDTNVLSQSQLATIEEAIDHARLAGQPLPSPFGLRAELQRQADAFLARLTVAESDYHTAHAAQEALERTLEAFERDLQVLDSLRSQLLMQLAGRNAECRVQAILEDLRDRVHLVTKFAYAPQWSEADRHGVDFIVWPHNCERPLELQVKASESEGHRFLDEQALASIEHQLDPRKRFHFIQLVVVAGKPHRQLQKDIERAIREWKKRFPLHTG